MEMHVLMPVSFYGTIYKSKYEVEKDIEEIQEGLNEAKNGLYKLAYMTDPKLFIDKDYEGSTEEWIDEHVKAIINDIGYAEVELYKLNLLLEMWDTCHTKDGKIITLPKEMLENAPIWEHAFGEGDWIESVNYPGVADGVSDISDTIGHKE